MRYIILIASVLLLLACASSKHASSNESMADEMLGTYMSGSDGAVAMRAPRGMLAAPAPMASASFDEEGVDKALSNADRRMINYNGNINLQSAEPEAVIDTVIERAKAKGGSVSNRRNGHVSLQIPVAEFRTFFDYILTLGNVTSKNISASDITDAFADNAARLRIAESTLARLQELLAVAKSEQEKIALLKEIQRVSEQIEQRKLEEKELLRRAAFSTINLWVSNMPAPVAPLRINIRAFEWFSRLTDPNMHPKSDKALKLQVPKDFIETESSKRIWQAASALNAKFWAYEKKNEPQGSPDFWANAMLEFFKPNYSAELKPEETFALIRLQTSHPDPEIYYIAILKTSCKKTLKIAQAHFPNKEAEQKNSKAILETLRIAK